MFCFKFRCLCFLLRSRFFLYCNRFFVRGIYNVLDMHDTCVPLDMRLRHWARTLPTMWRSIHFLIAYSSYEMFSDLGQNHATELDSLERFDRCYYRRLFIAIPTKVGMDAWKSKRWVMAVKAITMFSPFDRKKSKKNTMNSAFADVWYP